MADPIIFIGERGKVVDLALQLAAILAGDAKDELNIGRAFLLTIGQETLNNVTEAYKIKAKGGTDEMGIKWPPLKPSTIAARRVGPRDKKNDPAIKEREKLVAKEYRVAYKRLVQSMSPRQARTRAKQVSQAAVTRATGKTKVDVLGNRQVLILRDTGILLNSLGAGELLISGATVSYNKPSDSGGEYQVMEVQPGSVIVGTNVLYAATHQYGDAKRNVPRRQFLPDSDSEMPVKWWDRIVQRGESALAEGARMYFEAHGG